MIKTAVLKTGSRYSNHAQVQYEAAFAARFKELEHLPMGRVFGDVKYDIVYPDIYVCF